MRRRFSRFVYATALVSGLAVIGVGFAASGGDLLLAQLGSPPVADALSAGVSVGCSMSEALAKPLDPPVTSTLPRSQGFVAADYFKEDVSPAAEVRISWLGANFTRRFVVKVEDDPADFALHAYTLVRPSNNDEIVVGLGDRHETSLAALWCLLKLHAVGRSGVLRISALPNLFFIRDGAGELWVVDAIWGGAGWEIGASEMSNQHQWQMGSRVISR